MGVSISFIPNDLCTFGLPQSVDVVATEGYLLQLPIIN